MNSKSDNYITLNTKDCLNMSFEQSFGYVKNIIGSKNFQKALNIESNYPSPVENYKDTSWSQYIKIIGINTRITKTFWGIVKYALTFPEQGIHIMPLFETGDGSLYVQNSWDLNKDFLDDDLYKLGYKTPESQLRLTVNVLHAMGKIVGFDATAHVDNFSKIVLVNPYYFEWVKLDKDRKFQIPYNKIDYNLLYKDIQNIIIETLKLPKDTFEKCEKEKEELIFPNGVNQFKRRMLLRKAIRNAGYEPIPVVEHCPMRPITFDRIETDGNEDWAVFNIKDKSSAAKIFGAITPYKLYSTDSEGYPVINAVLYDSFEYFAQKICEFQNNYNFDFLRADMAHNQTAHSHGDDEKDINCDELWKHVKDKIQKSSPRFATMAESFFSTYYIDGVLDMINKDFDIVLGAMNFKHIDKNYLNLIDDFLNPFRENFRFSPCMTVFTNDGDLPGHNIFYQSNEENLVRCFISLFLNLPSYMGMGFELRDINPDESCKYSHFYVKTQQEDYSFGDNKEFFTKLAELRALYSRFKNVIEKYKLNLLYSLDNELSLCFEYVKKEKGYLFVVNINEFKNNIALKNEYKNIKLVFTSSDKITLNNNCPNVVIMNTSRWDFAVYEFTK